MFKFGIQIPKLKFITYFINFKHRICSGDRFAQFYLKFPKKYQNSLFFHEILYT